MENTNTARNFALQLGSLVSLYATIVALIMVVFGVITVLYPNELQMPWEYEGAQQSIRFGIALLVVFFPVFIILTRIVNQIRRKETGTYLSLTKWLVYLSLLIGGGVLLGDFVSVVLAYLNGEITIRFLLKALALSIVVGSAFYYYLLDARGYWVTNERKSKSYAVAVGCIVFAVLIAGFMQSDTPQETRARNADQKQVQDLQDMQWRIEDHYRTNKKLPEAIDTLYIGQVPPQAPEGREGYAYTVKDENTYLLCATFAFSSTRTSTSEQSRPVLKEATNPYNNWDYIPGTTCFERSITLLPDGQIMPVSLN